MSDWTDVQIEAERLMAGVWRHICSPTHHVSSWSQSGILDSIFIAVYLGLGVNTRDPVACRRIKDCSRAWTSTDRGLDEGTPAKT